MIIILEGPDNSGKSTLADFLRHQGGWPVLEYVPMLSGRTQPHEVSRKTLYDTIYNHKGKIVLTERFYPISDMIYRSMDQGPRIFSKLETGNILSGLSECRVIYCRPPIEVAETAKHSSSNDDDDKWLNFILPRLRESFHRYDSFMAKLAVMKVPVIHYDFTTPWALHIIQEVLQCAV